MQTQEQNPFIQLCVWPGTIVGPDQVESFIQWLSDRFDVRGKYDCEVLTNPDLDKYGNPVEGTGGRNDLFFYIHSEDVGKFAVPRLEYGIRWWEDVIKYNDTSKHLYSQEFLDNRPVTW